MPSGLMPRYLAQYERRISTMRSHWLLAPALSRTVHIKGTLLLERKRWVAIANIRSGVHLGRLDLPVPICQR